MKPAIICFLLAALTLKVQANDFSSFLSANASLAVVIDDDYMRKQNIDIISQVQKIIDDVIRENLLNGGLNVRYFTWASVRLKKDFVAAITVADCKRTWKFYENADQNSIMLLAVTEADCPRLPLSQAVMIPIIDRGEETPQLLLDIKVQKLLNWKSCVLLFDSSVESKSTQIIASLTLDSAKNMFKPIAVYLYKIEETLRYQQKREAIKDAVSKFINMKINRFVVFSSSIEEVMEIASNFKMFNVFNQWLFFLPKITDRINVNTLTQGLNEGANIAFAVNDTIVGCQETVLCSISELIMAFVKALSSIIREEGALYGEISDEEWEAIRMTKKERQTEILAYIKKYLKESSKCSGCSKWSFKSVESWGKSRRYGQSMQKIETEKVYYEFVDVGYWSPMFGFVAKDVLFPHSDHKFRNITLNILTYNNPPWQIIKRNSLGEIVESSGIVIELLRELSSRLNFTYKLYELRTDSDTIGGSENSSLVDLAGTLTNNIPPKLVDNLVEKNFFMAAIAATIDNIDSVPFNFTIPISVQSYTFISRRPNEVSRIYLFTAPFTITTWASLVAIILCIAPALYIINKFGPVEALRSTGLYKLKNCFWYIYGALLQQGGMYLPRADSGRVIIGIWWIVVIVLVTTYCGNLVAFLTFPRFQPGINYLYETFLHKDVATFGLRNGTYFEKYAMESSTRRDFKKFMEKVTIYSNTSAEEIALVEKGERINVDWKINLRFKIQKQFETYKECNFILGKEEFVDEQIGLILPSDSPYLELINDEIRRLHQMGFMQRWHQQFLPLIDKCNSQSQSRQITNHMVNLDDMQGCFLVLLLGFLFSAFVIILEFGVHRCQKPRNERFKMFKN